MHISAEKTVDLDIPLSPTLADYLYVRAKTSGQR